MRRPFPLIGEFDCNYSAWHLSWSCRSGRPFRSWPQTKLWQILLEVTWNLIDNIPDKLFENCLWSKLKKTCLLSCGFHCLERVLTINCVFIECHIQNGAFNSVYDRIFVWRTKFIAFGSAFWPHKLRQEILESKSSTLHRPNSSHRTMQVYRFNVLNHFPVYKLLLLSRIYFGTVMTAGCYCAPRNSPAIKLSENNLETHLPEHVSFGQSFRCSPAFRCYTSPTRGAPSKCIKPKQTDKRWLCVPHERGDPINVIFAIDFIGRQQPTQKILCAI